MFEKEFREWFESNKKWLFRSDPLQAAYFAWCAGIQQQQAAQQSVQPTGGTVAPANIDQRPEVDSAGENNQRPATSG